MNTRFSLADAIREKVSVDEIAKTLDAMSHAERVAQMGPVGGKLQGALYEMAHGRTTELSYFVPDGCVNTEIIHEGRNFAPAFNRFQKRFARIGDEITGYNEQTFKLFTGPGYFVGEVLDNPEGLKQFAINYTKTPTQKMPGWPKILPAAARLGRFVYGGAHDWMWGISSHMSIGRVHKQGKWHDMWFILTREDSR